LPATLTANSTIAGTTYSWAQGGETTPSITVNPSSTTSYTVTGSAVGCIGTAVATVFVNQTPTVGASSTTVCAGQPGTITATGAATYSWAPGGSTVNPLVASPLATTQYAVTGTTAGCSASSIGTINVNPIPNVGIISDATICAGQQGTLTATGAGAGTYAWSDNSTASSLIAAPPTTTSYTVIGTAANCSASAIGIINVNQLPIVSATSDTICAGDTATLTANSTIAGTTYSWSPGGIGSPITVNPKVTTIYTVTGSSLANGLTCTATATATVTATPIPKAAFIAPLIINLSEANISFHNNSTNASTWFWDFGDSTTSFLQNPQHLYTDTATYKVLLQVSSNGCTDTVSHRIRIVPDVLVYIPNAFTPDGDGLNDGFSFKGTGIAAGTANFDFLIFDRWGELIFETHDVTKQWMGDFNGTPCQQDIYVYKLIVKDNLGKEKSYVGWVTLLR
jgi:gliding motility-associated-like protein